VLTRGFAEDALLKAGAIAVHLDVADLIERYGTWVCPSKALRTRSYERRASGRGIPARASP
jgi:hypothetical protein